jgi:CheY-like chemotaxis protein
MKFSSHKTPAAHLLMVDDNKMGLNARKVVMEELGYRVTTVVTPGEALERLSEERYDVVITDYKMPSMNGADLIKRMRKMECSTPVILISGFVDALGLDESSTGADVVIQKSAHEVAHMVRSVKSLLRKKTLRKKPATSQSTAPKAKRKHA